MARSLRATLYVNHGFPGGGGQSSWKKRQDALELATPPPTGRYVGSNGNRHRFSDDSKSTPERDPAACEVVAHRRLGGVGFAGFHGAVDARMGVIASLVLAWLHERDLTLLEKPGRHRIMECKERGIAHDPRENEVKRDVRFDEALDIADRATIGGERRLELVHVFRGRVRRRVPDEADLHEKAHALELPLAVGAGQHLLNGGTHPCNHALNRWPRHPGRRTVADLHQT